MSIIDKMEEVPEDSIKTWRKERKKLRKEYRKLYSDTFTDEQAKRYYKLKGQFNKHITTLQLEDMGETLNEAGKKAKKSMKRTGKKIQGWIEGFSK